MIIINIFIIIHLNFFIFSFIIVGYVIVYYFINIYLFIFLFFYSFFILNSFLLHSPTFISSLTFFVSLISRFQVGHLRSRSAPCHLHFIISYVVIPTGLKILREEHLDYLKYRENSVAFVLLLCQLQFYGLVNVAGFG